MPDSCGACNLCCTVLNVPDIQKPRNMTCWWTSIHGGCERQADKQTDPMLQACAQFKCVYLESQETDKAWPRYLRPDQCHVVFGPPHPTDNGILFVHVDKNHPTAWKEPAVADKIDHVVNGGGRVEVFIGDEKVCLS